MNMQLRQCFVRATPFRLKKARKSLILSDFFVFQKKPKAFKRGQNLRFWLQKSQIHSNPDRQFSVFDFAETYTGPLYYVMIRFLCRAQSMIVKFAHTAQIQVANLTGRLP